MMIQSLTSGRTRLASAFNKTSVRHLHVEKRIEEMGFKLRDSASKPQANYVSVRKSGRLIFLSGHLPFDEENNFKRGKVVFLQLLEQFFTL